MNTFLSCWLLIELDGFPLFLNHLQSTLLYSHYHCSEALVVLAVVIISKPRQTSSLNSHSSVIIEGVNGLTDS